MKKLTEYPYRRAASVEYAHQWAYSRNQKYYDFEKIGGDCTNFASQCILAGTGAMNFTPTFGWYYLDLDHRSPSWTGVEYLYDFLTSNKGVGPFAAEVSASEVQPGDLCQLRFEKKVFQHSPVVVKAASPASPESILVAAHSYDADNRPLSSYEYTAVRFLHLLGYREWGDV